VLGSVLDPIIGVELSKEVFTSRARWMSLIVEWNASANMFYILRNLLLLIMVIFKLKCNNLIFNEIMVLNALYVCLHAFSLRRESPDPDPERRTPHFWGGSITRSLRHVGCWRTLRYPHLRKDTWCHLSLSMSRGLVCLRTSSYTHSCDPTASIFTT
jgi:hypothetical protein